MPSVMITGIGAISPLGNTVDEHREAFAQGKSGLSRLEMFTTRYADLLYFGEIKTSSDALRSILGVSEKNVTRNSLLALHAMQEALQMSGLEPQQIAASGTALIGANTTAGICLTDELYHDANRDTNPSAYINDYDAGSINIFLQRIFNIKGVVNTINTACSSSANAIAYGTRLIKSGMADRAIVGGVDSLAKFTINGFNALGILSSEKCRPFDKNRNGLNLGEGAAFLILEREDLTGNKKILAEVTGYANTNDAYHPSSLSPQGNGPYLAMKTALETAGLKPYDIGYINTHGTGTENNDEVEAIAMGRLFEKIPAFGSSKSSIGHTLGAAGAIEAVVSVLNLMYQEIFPSLNFDTPMYEQAPAPATHHQKVEIAHIMSNSFGFGAIAVH